MNSVEFEHQVKKIHDVLVQNHGTVTWNEKIPDPDNPKQSRQIDIAVRIHEKLIHIECRHHKKPQDTKWIEELFGRKISLQADVMMAVSSSGFTEGATRKARRLGVFIYGFDEISQEAIKNLGDRTVVDFTYYKFSNLQIGYYLHSIVGLPLEGLLAEVVRQKEAYTTLFNQIKYSLSQNIDFSFPYGFNFSRIECDNIFLFGKKVVGMSVRGDVEKFTNGYSCPLVWAFESADDSGASIARVEKSGDGKLEIIKTRSGFSRVDIDLSLAPQSPANSVFYGVEFGSLPGSKSYPPKFNLIGRHEHQFNLADAEFMVADIDV